RAPGGAGYPPSLLRRLVVAQGQTAQAGDAARLRNSGSGGGNRAASGARGTPSAGHLPAAQRPAQNQLVLGRPGGRPRLRDRGPARRGTGAADGSGRRGVGGRRPRPENAHSSKRSQTAQSAARAV